MTVCEIMREKINMARANAMRFCNDANLVLFWTNAMNGFKRKLESMSISELEA